MGFQADYKLIDRISQLSKLELTDSEKELAREEITSLGIFFEQLQELDVSGIEPLSHLFPLPLREDKVEETETFVEPEFLEVPKTI